MIAEKLPGFCAVPRLVSLALSIAFPVLCCGQTSSGCAAHSRGFVQPARAGR